MKNKLLMRNRFLVSLILVGLVCMAFSVIVDAAYFGYNSTTYSGGGDLGLYGPYCGKYTCPYNSKAKSITAYIETNSATYYDVRCAIYYASNGTKIAETETKSLNGVLARYVEFNFSTQPYLSASVEYLLAADSNCDVSAKTYLRYYTDAAYWGARDTTQYTMSFPSTWSSDSTYGRRFNIYCTYENYSTWVNRAPSFSNEYPTNTSVDVPLYPFNNITVGDADGNSTTVCFWTNHSGSWVKTQQNNSVPANTTVRDMNASWCNDYHTKYWWRVTADDTWVNSSVIYWFVTAWEENFTLLWTSNPWYIETTNIFPLFSDLNGDLTKDVVFCGYNSTVYTHGTVIALDGTDGSKLWQYNCTGSGIIVSDHCSMELSDLNNDGVDDVLVPGYSKTVALDGLDGSELWTSNESGNEEMQVILDVNDSGFPVVYVCHAGTGSALNGHIAMVNGTTGVTMKRVNVWYSSHGGLSAGDINGDGLIELVYTERKWSTGNFSSQGVVAYDLSLNKLWNRSDIGCSSHPAGLIDVNGDTILDVVVSQQSTTNAGIYCLWGSNGSNITGFCVNSITGFQVHENFALYDVNSDGSIEMAAGLTTINVVNLSTLAIVATLTGYGEAPYYANVLVGDDLEIVLGSSITPIRIYDNAYVQRDTITGYTCRELAVDDLDGDGFNEMVTVGTELTGGYVRCYRTLAVASVDSIRSNVSSYSEYRLRTSVSIPMLLNNYSGSWTNHAPVISNPSPVNKSTNIDLYPILSVLVSDADGNSTTVCFWSKVGVSWVLFQVNNSVTANTTVRVMNYTVADTNETTYYWMVTANDTWENSSAWYRFKTQNNEDLPFYLQMGFDAENLFLFIWFLLACAILFGKNVYMWFVSSLGIMLISFSSAVDLLPDGSYGFFMVATVIVALIGFLRVFNKVMENRKV